jgi:hypothetical protein
MNNPANIKIMAKGNGTLYSRVVFDDIILEFSFSSLSFISSCFFFNSLFLLRRIIYNL